MGRAEIGFARVIAGLGHGGEADRLKPEAAGEFIRLLQGVDGHGRDLQHLACDNGIGDQFIQRIGRLPVQRLRHQLAAGFGIRRTRRNRDIADLVVRDDDLEGRRRVQTVGHGAQRRHFPRKISAFGRSLSDQRPARGGALKKGDPLHRQYQCEIRFHQPVRCQRRGPAGRPRFQHATAPLRIGKG